MAVRNPIAFTFDCDPDWDTYDDYYIVLKVIVEGTLSGYTVELPEFPDENAQVKFDIHRLIEGELSPDLPNMVNTQALFMGDNMNKSYTYLAEEWIDGVLDSTQALSTDHYACRAGLNLYSQNTLNGFADAGKFLTYQPANKVVTEDQLEWLYLIAGAQGEDWELRYDVTLTDGSQVLNQIYGSSHDAIDRYEVMGFPTGYAQLNLSTHGEVDYWEVWVQNPGGSVISQRQTYTLNCCDISEYNRYFLFENSLGGFDTVRLTGKALQDFETVSTDGERVREVGASVSTRDLFYNNTQSRDGAEQATGYLTEEEVLWLRDLLRSEEVYRFGGYDDFTGTGTLQPIQVNRGASRIREDGNFLYGIRLIYTDANWHAGI